LKNKKSLDELESTEELHYLKSWLAADSKRGLHGFIDVST
jgi:UDP-N-acetylglucosamine acyltransferase